MKDLTCALAAAGLLFGSSVAVADDTMKVSVPVGGSTTLHLGNASLGGCDDPYVARVEDMKTSLRVVGLKAGRTQCGVFTQSNPKQPKILDITVTSTKR